jgi:hypothetical protein
MRLIAIRAGRSDSIENHLLRPFHAVGESHTRVKRRQRLGGMLSYYYRELAALACHRFIKVNIPDEVSRQSVDEA